MTSAQTSRVTAARSNPAALAGAVVAVAVSVAVLAGAALFARGRRCRFPTSLLPGRQMITRRQIQEHRFEVWLDRCELGDVQTLIGQQPA